MISFSEALLPQKFVIESKEMRVSFHIVRSCSSKISATKVSFESQVTQTRSYQWVELATWSCWGRLPHSEAKNTHVLLSCSLLWLWFIWVHLLYSFTWLHISQWSGKSERSKKQNTALVASEKQDRRKLNRFQKVVKKVWDQPIFRELNLKLENQDCRYLCVSCQNVHNLVFVPARKAMWQQWKGRLYCFATLTMRTYPTSRRKAKRTSTDHWRKKQSLIILRTKSHKVS